MARRKGSTQAREILDPVRGMDARLLAARTATGPTAAETAITLGNGSQLFVDDYLVAASASAHRRINRPEKQDEPILVPDRPWEGQGLCYGSLVEHEGAWRLYYKGWCQNTPLNFDEHVRARGRGKYPVCLARSTDGLTFRKETVRGSVRPRTNIVLDEQVDDFNVLKDPADPDPSRRFKLLASVRNWWAGLTPATSPDGIRWTWGRENAVAFLGDRCSYWYDPVRKKHIAWSRNYQIMPGRVIVQKETSDFDHWSDERASHPRLILQPDRMDHPMTQFYGGYGFWYRSLYLAYLEVYHIHHQRLETQLACSRDGLSWTRVCERDTFLANGEHGAFDAYWAVPTFNAPILHRGRLLIHYNGRPDPHLTPGFKHVPPGMGGAFGLATLREDGFVSLDVTGEEGVVETKLLQLPARWSRFEINAGPFNTRLGYDPMEMAVEVLAPDRRVRETVRLRGLGDGGRVWHRVRFKRPLPPKVRLRFRMRNARLYSFRFA